MQGYFGNTVIDQGTQVELLLTLANSGVGFSWEPVYGSYYTVMVYDEDAHHLHYLVVNIPGADILQGEIIAPFSPFRPPSGKHRYSFLLYQQNGLIEVAQVDRDDFDPDVFAQEADLTEVGWFTLVTGHTSPSRTPLPSPLPSPLRTPLSSESTPFIAGNTLTERQQKYCSCIAKVAAKGRVDNPYAVCAKSTGTTSRHCGESYDWEAMPDDRLIALARLEGIPVPDPYKKQTLLNHIREFKQRKYGV